MARHNVGEASDDAARRRAHGGALVRWSGGAAAPGGGALAAALRTVLRTAGRQLAGVREPASGSAGGHPLAPAAIRVERHRARHGGARSDQTAVTVWFGEGPSLPGALSGHSVARTTMRLGAGMLGAAALAAATVVAARREEQRSPADPGPPRLSGPAAPRPEAGDEPAGAAAVAPPVRRPTAGGR